MTEPTTISTYPAAPGKPILDCFHPNDSHVIVKWEMKLGEKARLRWWVDEHEPHEEDILVQDYTLNNLQRGCRYNFQVAIIISRNSMDMASEYSETLYFSTAPKPPTGLQVSLNTLTPETSINIEFDDDDACDSFDITLRSLSTGEIILKNKRDHFACIKQLTPGDTYDVRVEGIKDDVHSSKSKIDQPIQTRPAKVENVSAVRSSATSYIIKWEEAFGAKSYTIQYKRSDQNYVTKSTKDNELTLENLDRGQTYMVRVAAVITPTCMGKYSDTKQFTTSPPSPSNIQLEPLYSRNEVTLEVGFEGSRRHNHIVTVVVDGNEEEPITTTTKSLHAIVSQITLGSLLTVCVQAIHANGGEVESDKIYAEPIWIKPGLVTDIRNKLTSTNAEKITWQAVPGATSYVGKYEGNGNVEEFKESGTYTILKELRVNTKYSVLLAAINKGGMGDFSKPIDFQTALSQPSNVQISIMSNHSNPNILAKWNKCEGAVQYYIDLLEITTNTIVEHTFESDKCFHEFKKFKDGCEYKVSIQCIAQNTERSSETIKSDSIWTLPGQVTGIKVTIEDRTTRTIEWDEINGVVSYKVTLRRARSRPHAYSTETNSIVMTDLELSSDYSLSVIATNSSGDGRKPAEIKFETALFPPTNLRVVNNRTNPTTSLDVSFDPPDFLKQNSSKFQITYGTSTLETDTNTTLNNLQPGTAHRVAVCSLHPNNVDLNSEKLTLITPVCTKLPPIAIEKETISQNELKLFWGDVHEAKSYAVYWRIENGEWESKANLNANEFFLKHLEPGENYEAYIRAINQAGEGDKSIIKFTTVPETPTNLKYKILSTQKVQITCDPCHGASTYIFNINGENHERETPECRHKCDKDVINVKISSVNNGGTSGQSERINIRQTLNFLRKKFSKIASNNIKKENFILPVLTELQSGRVTKEFGCQSFQICIGETVLIIGDPFTGKTSCCSYFLQNLSPSKLGIFVDYDEIKSFVGKLNIQRLLQKYMTDISSDEMEFLIEWMKDNSDQVTFVVDNFNFTADHAEKQVSYDDIEAPMHVFLASLKTNRSMFPESQVLCITSQRSIHPFLKPGKTWIINGFEEDEVEEMKYNMRCNRDIPPHLLPFCRNPGFCEILLQLLHTNLDTIDLSSSSAVLVYLFSQSLSRYAGIKRNEKLRQLVKEIREVPDTNKKVPEKMKKIKDQLTSPGLSDIHSFTDLRNDYCNLDQDKSCRLLHDNIITAIYFAMFSPYEEFKKRIQKKAIRLGNNSLIWIIASGLLREETRINATKVFPLENKNKDEVKKKLDLIVKIVKNNMEAILTQVKTEYQIVLDWFACCNELNNGNILKLCNLKIKFEDSTTADEMENQGNFLRYVSEKFCGNIRVEIKTEDPTKTLSIDQAIRDNPNGNLITIEEGSTKKNIFGSMSRKNSKSVISVTPAIKSASSQRMRKISQTENEDDVFDDESKKRSPVRKNNSDWIPPDTLRTVDLDATDVSEFTLDTRMIDGCSMKSSPRVSQNESWYSAESNSQSSQSAKSESEKISRREVSNLSTLDTLYIAETEGEPGKRALLDVLPSTGETPSRQSKSGNIQIKKHDCTLSNVELVDIAKILRESSDVDLVEFCDCKIGNDYCTPAESQKNTAKCKISKLVISYTDHFKEFSRFFYSTFGGCEIKSLCLVYANLDDQDVEKLQRFMLKKQVKGIESLDISYNKKITRDGFGQIGNLIAEQGIKTLKAISCDLEKMKLEKLFEGLKNVNLRELDIGYNDNLTENGFEMLARLVAFRGIEILKLRGCQLTEKTIQVFYNKLKEDDEKVLLDELDVSYNPEMNPPGCEVLGLIIKKFGISTLNLAGCGISEEHLTSLKSMEDIELRAINLRDNSYPGNIIEEIASIVSKFKIQELDLSDCMFSVSELVDFRTNLNGTKLQKLHIGDKVRELGMEYIQEVCHLLQTVIEMLYLWFHRLDNSCRRLLNEQSEKLSVSIQLCDEPEATSG